MVERLTQYVVVNKYLFDTEQYPIERTIKHQQDRQKIFVNT